MVFAGVFSISASPVHPYYLAMLGPPIGFFLGIGVTRVVDGFGHGDRRVLMPIAALGLTAAWQAYVLGFVPSWQRWLVPGMLLGVAVVAGLLWIAARTHQSSDKVGRISAAAFAVGVAILLVCPAVWSLTPVLGPGARMVPVADRVLMARKTTPATGERGAEALSELTGFLRDHRTVERYLVAAADIHPLAPIIIETGEPVLPYGGFSGGDPILSIEQFEAMVRAGELRYVLLAESFAPGRFGPPREDQIGAWVKTNGKRVAWRPSLVESVHDAPPRPPSPWRDVADIVEHMYTQGAIALYDCRPGSR